MSVETKVSYTYQRLILEAVSALKDYKKGSSIEKIKKYIEENYHIEVVKKVYLDALDMCVEQGLLEKNFNSYKIIHQTKD